MRKYMEPQGPDVLPEEFEDEVWERNAEGEMVKLEVPDDDADD